MLLGLPSILRAQQPVDVFPAQFELNGLHEGRQLLVTGPAQRDLTRTATYATEPANVVRVSTSGYVRPIGKGAAVILIPGLSSSRDVYAAEAKLLTTSLHLIQIAGPNASGPSQLIESATILLASNHHRDHNTGDVR